MTDRATRLEAQRRETGASAALLIDVGEGFVRFLEVPYRDTGSILAAAAC
jgi:hypothetical protein